MRSSTGPEAAAILAVSRTVTPQVSINGSTTTWPVTEYQTDAQMADTPAQISLLGGVAARQVTFKIAHTFYKQISPYQVSMVPAANPLPIGAAIQVTVQLGTRVWTIFTGNVIQISSLDAVSDITVMAQDSSFNLGSLITLPAAGVTSVAGLDTTLDLYYSPLAVIDLCLRGCGQYLTFPPVLTGATRASFTVLSIPNCGGMIPDVGSVVQQFIPNGGSIWGARRTGSFYPDVIGGSPCRFRMAQNLGGVQDFQLWRLDTQVSVQSAATSGTILTGGSALANAFGGAHPGVNFSAATGAVTVGVGTAGGGFATFTSGASSIADGNWHHLNVTLTRVSGVVTCAVAIDGSTLSITAPQSITDVSWVDEVGAGDTVTFGPKTATNSTKVFVEALEMIYVPTGVTYVDPADRNGQTAPLSSAITPTTARLQAILPQTGLNAWQTIQSVAAAEGALCWFDEDGRFTFEPRTTWLARRTQPAARTFDPSSLTNLQMSLAVDGLRKSVSANYQTVTAQASTAASPAYTADAVLQFNAGTTTTPIQTDQLFFNPSAAAVGASNAAGSSWFVPVLSATVGDPAAIVATGVSVTIVPTSTGFNLIVQNPYPTPISFWNPTAGTIPQGPALIIHGTKIITSNPQKVVSLGDPSAADDLALDDNPWRQSQALAQQLTLAAAADCYSAIPVFQSVEVPGDPRVQLGDVVNLLAPHLPNGVLCVVVDIAHNVSPSNVYSMTLGVRPIGAPTGWILSVTGRTELGTATYLPLPG